MSALLEICVDHTGNTLCQLLLCLWLHFFFMPAHLKCFCACVMPWPRLLFLRTSGCALGLRCLCASEFVRPVHALNLFLFLHVTVQDFCGSFTCAVRSGSKGASSLAKISFSNQEALT